LVIPAARPPHKLDALPTRFESRVEMIRLALGDAPEFAVDLLEIERDGPSYTADTLDELHRRRPGDEFFLLLGSDSLPDVPKWHDPKRIVARAGLVVMERPGWPVYTAHEIAAAIGVGEASLSLQKVEVPLIDIASRDIRRRVAAGRSVRFMLPAAVERYIRDQRLYRPA
jgi:nicotinate-nucleotide adenylyltransferase